jgi:uncharacterized protein (DUF433 family)
MDESELMQRITADPRIFGGKHVLAMMAAGDSPETVLQGYPWMERHDILACLVYAKRLVAHERVELVQVEAKA